MLEKVGVEGLGSGVGRGALYAKRFYFFAEMIVSWSLSILKNYVASPLLSAFLRALKNLNKESSGKKRKV